MSRQIKTRTNRAGPSMPRSCCSLSKHPRKIVAIADGDLPPASAGWMLVQRASERERARAACSERERSKFFGDRGARRGGNGVDVIYKRLRSTKDNVRLGSLRTYGEPASPLTPNYPLDRCACALDLAPIASRRGRDGHVSGVTIGWVR